MKIDKLLILAKKITMTNEEREQQRRSFAYGNAKLANSEVTRESINRAADKNKSLVKP